MLEHRHQAQIAVRPIASGSVAHYAFIDKAKALVKVAGTGIVLVDVKKETVRLKLRERDADQLFQDPAACTPPGHTDHDPLQFDCPACLGQPAQYGVALKLASLGFAHKVACIIAGERHPMALVAPLANEVPGTGALSNSMIRGTSAGAAERRLMSLDPF
jgi:hypothetical protein